MSFLKEFDYKQFLRRFNQESTLVVLAFVCMLYLLINVLIKKNHQSTIRKIEKNIRRYTLANQLKKKQSTMNDLQVLLHDTGDLNYFISKIDRLLRKHGAVNVSISRDSEKKSTGVKRLSFIVKWQMRLPGIMVVLEDLEQSEKMSYVSLMRIKRATEVKNHVDKVENPLMDIVVHVDFFAKD